MTKETYGALERSVEEVKEKRTAKCLNIDEELFNLRLEFYPSSVLCKAQPEKEIREIDSGTLTSQGVKRISQLLSSAVEEAREEARKEAVEEVLDFVEYAKIGGNDIDLVEGWIGEVAKDFNS